MNADCVIVDANIAFKALVSQRGDLRDRLDPSANLNQALRAKGFSLFYEP
jgi:hypothetical protein